MKYPFSIESAAGWEQKTKISMLLKFQTYDVCWMLVFFLCVSVDVW